MPNPAPDAYDLLRQHQETGSPPLGDLAPEGWLREAIESDIPEVRDETKRPNRY